jgi:nucleoside-diphosphate-sugar epimerase
MRIFILGGTGFIGYHAVLELLKRGHQIRILSLPPEPPADLFPANVEIVLGYFNKMADGEMDSLFNGCEGVVFAAGADDRITPTAPAYPFFYEANVQSSTRFFRLAKKAGVKKGVLLGSYFAHFDRLWPELQLSEHHPYIRSRVEQEKESLAIAGHDLDLAILELPYIFGYMPGKKPLWKPLVKYLHWPLPWVFYTRGGSAMVGVNRVAEAIVGALEQGKGGERYLIGDENLTWCEFLTRLAAAGGLNRKVLTLPNWIAQVGLWCVKIWHRIRGLEGGLDPTEFIKLQTRETFFDPNFAQAALGFSGGGLDEAFEETIKGCGYPVMESDQVFDDE